MRSSGPWAIVGRVWPRHEQRGRPLNSIVRQHRHAVATSKMQRQLKSLQRKVSAFTTAELTEDAYFSCCLRASFSKSYEFCVEAHRPRRKPTAFFLAPTLRSICEDLIVLAYIARMPTRDRNHLAALLMRHELGLRLRSQVDFFTLARPDQPVLHAKIDVAALRDEIRALWQRNGWPGLRKEWMPPVRQLAEKYDAKVLATLYEYIYRLTSGMVHFNPQVLLRSGWGDPPKFHFSPSNFNDYYLAYARTYGVLLLCLYFELFPGELDADSKTSATIEALKETLLLEQRWPEMVTYEEMNRPHPKGQEVFRIALRLMDVQQRKERGRLSLLDPSSLMPKEIINKATKDAA
jgi:hypothetical protein